MLKKHNNINEYLQGDNPNLVGTIIGFRKSVKLTTNNSSDASWFSVLFYFDHLSGRIERYSINNSNKENAIQLLANTKYKDEFYSKLGIRSINKIFFESFILDLINTYSITSSTSYLNPLTELINRSLLNYTSPNYIEELPQEERKLFIKLEDLKDKPEICVTNNFYTIPALRLSMARRNVVLTTIDSKSEHPQVILDLKSVLNSKSIKSEAELSLNIKKFNAFTKIKLNKML